MEAYAGESESHRIFRRDSGALEVSSDQERSDEARPSASQDTGKEEEDGVGEGKNAGRNLEPGSCKGTLTGGSAEAAGGVETEAWGYARCWKRVNATETLLRSCRSSEDAEI